MVKIPDEIREALQKHFHDVIRERARSFELDEHPLPVLADYLYSSEEQPYWFAYPGMYGGFAFRFEGEGEQTQLISESWMRILQGSGERHVITIYGSTLTDTGFA